MFIGELAGSSINNGNTWVAVVEVTVLDESGDPVPDTLVSGEWDLGDGGSVSCRTDAGGTCELESNSLRKRIPQTVLEITGLEHGNLVYQPDLDEVDDPGERPRELVVRKP